MIVALYDARQVNESLLAVKEKRVRNWLIETESEVYESETITSWSRESVLQREAVGVCIICAVVVGAMYVIERVL